MIFQSRAVSDLTLIGADELLASLGWLEAPPLLSVPEIHSTSGLPGKKELEPLKANTPSVLC
jgi:hypothetical protein